MLKQSKGLCALFLVALTVLLGGCGSGGSSDSSSSGTASTTTASSTAPVSGRATMTPINGGIVFADRIVNGLSNFIKDGTEVGASTDANGNYSMPAPDYSYVLVSRDGKDQYNNDQILMLAPQGSRNITPLTSLVALDTTGTPGSLAAKLQALQGNVSYDTDIYTNSSPAIMMLVKSVEISVQSLSATFQAKSFGGNSLSRDQIYYIQGVILKNIALTLKGSARNLNVPNALYLDLTTALTNAINELLPLTTNAITVGTTANTVADQIALKAVDAASGAYGTNHNSFGGLSTACGSSTAESTLNGFVTSFGNAKTNTITAISPFIIAAPAAPPTFTVTTLPVITISASVVITGSGGGTGGLGGGF